MSYFSDTSIFSSSLTFHQAIENCHTSIDGIDDLHNKVTITGGELPLPFAWWDLNNIQNRIDHGNEINGWSANFHEIAIGADCQVSLWSYHYTPALMGTGPVAYLFKFKFDKMVEALVKYENAHKAVWELAALQVVRDGCPAEWEENIAPWQEILAKLSDETDFGRNWGGAWYNRD